MSQYIQIKTGIKSATVTQVDGKKREIHILADDVTRTTYLDSKRARMLGLALLKAAANAEIPQRGEQ